MTLETYCNEHPLYGAAKAISDRAKNINSGLLLKISTRFNIMELLSLYFIGDNCIYAYLDNEWAEKVSHTINTGHKAKHILMQSIGAYSLNYFIKDKFGFTIHPKNFEFMNYSYSKFLELAKMETAMLLAKYDDLHTFEVTTACIRLLFKYFYVYNVNGMTEEKTWAVTMADINTVINTILSSDLSEFKPYTDIITPGLQILLPAGVKQQRKDKVKPTCADDLLECVDDTMSQKEKYSAVMEAWGIKSERSVQRLFQ